MTGDVIRSFNRDTAWLATGVLGALVLAALMLAVEEHNSKPMMQAGRDFLVSANPAAVASATAESSYSNGKTDTPLYDLPSRQTESAASTPIPAPASTPEKFHDAPRQESMQAPAPKTRNVRNRSFLASRTIDVKRRLLELWHQSLAKIERSGSWTAFSNLKRGVNKKAAYTAAARD